MRPVALFLTAFDYDAVEALEGARIGYLLKPISDQRLEAELTRAARIFEQGWRELFEQRLQKLLALSAAPEPWPQRFLVREGETVRTVELEAVEWIESQGDGVALHAAGREHPVRLTMQAIAQRLDPDRFLRIHRSTIVRLDRIARVEPVVAGEDVITLVSGASVRIGKTYRESVRSVLQGRLHESGGILFPAVRGRSSTGRATDF
ncbi:MAG: hypothetical protein FJ206_16745 [Gemmatimonadetes bacterium]|nr:hypothetical protein [Gemmatimonadota bacterium]